MKFILQWAERDPREPTVVEAETAADFVNLQRHYGDLTLSASVKCPHCSGALPNHKGPYFTLTVTDD